MQWGASVKKLAGLAVSLSMVCCAPAVAQSARGGVLSMDRVYQGRIQLPDFAGRDRQFARFRTRIVNEMQTGPNFAGHYAMVETGCGTGCRFVIIGDVATGKVTSFPYGGEKYNMLQLTYSVKSNYVSAVWASGNNCYSDTLEWNGATFKSSGVERFGNSDAC